MSAISHVKSNVIADFTGTITGYNSQGSTTTIAATDLVRPVDWNSYHNQAISVSGITEGTSSHAATNLVFGGTNGVRLSLSTQASAATMWIGKDYESYFRNIDALQGWTTMVNNQSTSALFPFYLEGQYSFDFIRLLESGSNIGASTTIATTNNANITAGLSRSANIVIYSRGTGASSMSLQYLTSTQITDQQSIRVSANATAGSRYSVTLRQTLPCSTGTTDFTNDFSASQTNISFTSSGITNLTGRKQMDYKFPMSLQPGQYWMAFGISTTLATSSSNAGSRLIVTYCQGGVSQINSAFGVLGADTHASVNLRPGHGSFSTAGGGTTASIPISAASSTASQNVMYVQFMRIA
jgi:hypothetical protein